MRLFTIFAYALVLGGVFAAPATGTKANIMKRNDQGASVIDFDYVLATIRDINTRYEKGSSSSLQKRDDADFIDLFIMELHNSDLLNDFVDELVSAPHLTSALEESVHSSISGGLVNETVLMSSLRNAGRLPEFFESVLNDKDLNQQLYVVARDVMESVEAGGELAARHALTESAPFLSGLYAKTVSSVYKRDYYNDDLLENAYGMSKRDILSTIFTIVKEITSSDLVKLIVRSIIGNQSLVQYTITLVSRIFANINWLTLFTTIKNSGIIRSIFSLIMKLLSGLFSGSSLSELINELFSGSTNSTMSLFLGNLLSVAVEIGGEIFASLTKSGGLLSELLGTFLNGTSTSSSSSSSPSGGSFLLSIFDTLFGGSSSSGSRSPGSSSSGSSSPSGSSGASGSSGGLLSGIFDSLFGGSSSSSSSPETNSGSTSSSSGLGALAESLIDSLFSGSNSGSSPPVSSPSGSSSPGSSSSGSIKSCCCSTDKIKKRALKRALKRKVKRSIKRTIAGGKAQLPEGMYGYLVATN